ncbi:hypothetical protein MNBD_ALPHA06-1602 [hydrothermal vent metagenome]|uniref:Uncharacterized protein n=1 Tax=hydrothermal vent metagenome TaxID=652676 RepID=A0A3B0SRY7_9ZZZZ
MGAVLQYKQENPVAIMWKYVLVLVLFIGLGTSVLADEPTTEPEPEQLPITELQQQEADSQQQLVNSLLSLSETLVARHQQLAALNKQLLRTSKDAEKAELRLEIDALTTETRQVEQNIDLVILGLQARQYNKDNREPEKVNISDEISRILQPIVMSLQRTTEPARRMEELRQLADQAESRITIAKNTLQSINIFRQVDAKYPKDVKERLDRHYELWTQRLQEAQDLDLALAEQLAATQRARGSSLKQFSADFGSFILNRGVSLLLAVGLSLGFILTAQLLRTGASHLYRRTHGGVLSAGMRIFSMSITLISIIGGFVIAVSIFNIRQDWLMLAMSLLLAVALSWTFLRSLPALTEQTRLLMNLGAVREGERTIVEGLPYRIERLAVYTKLVNPALKGGELIYPVQELIGMHSRPVTEGETWFPTKIGDWIVRDNKHYEVINQTPEHVILKRPGGAEDFLPSTAFMNTMFEVITDGYRVSYQFGLDYQHMNEAQAQIPKKIDASVSKKIRSALGKQSLISMETRFVSLGDSALMFTVLVDMGPGHGKDWQKLQKFINLGVVEACLTNKWAVPFPQLVIHKA